MLYATGTFDSAASLLNWPERVGTVRAVTENGSGSFMLHPTPSHALLACGRSPSPAVFAVDYRPAADDAPLWPMPVIAGREPEEDYLCRVIFPAYDENHNTQVLAAAASFAALSRTAFGSWRRHWFTAAMTMLAMSDAFTVSLFNDAADAFADGIIFPDDVAWPEDAWEFIRGKKWQSHCPPSMEATSTALG